MHLQASVIRAVVILPPHNGRFKVHLGRQDFEEGWFR